MSVPPSLTRNTESVLYRSATGATARRRPCLPCCFSSPSIRTSWATSPGPQPLAHTSAGPPSPHWQRYQPHLLTVISSSLRLFRGAIKEIIIFARGFCQHPTSCRFMSGQHSPALCCKGDWTNCAQSPLRRKFVRLSSNREGGFDALWGAGLWTVNYGRRGRGHKSSVVTLISFHPGVCIVWFDTLAVDWPHTERARNERGPSGSERTPGLAPGPERQRGRQGKLGSLWLSGGLGGSDWHGPRWVKAEVEWSQTTKL